MVKIFTPGYLYCDGSFHPDYAVAVENGVIIEVGEVGKISKRFPEATVESGWERLIMVPGCVNGHNHCFQSLLRGLACDRPFLEWREKALYNYSPKLTLEHTYVGALMAFGEMMKCGVTTVTDFFYLHNYGLESDEMIIRAAKDLGIRLVLARTMYDWDGAPTGYRESIELARENTRKLNRKYQNDSMVNIIPAPHSLHAATPDMIVAGYELAKELNTGYHIHVAEEPFEVEEIKNKSGGLSTLEYLDMLGVVDDRMTIIHGVYLKPSEIELMGQKGVSLVYCPSSNMFLADGITDIVKMMECGVTIGLGTDGACANSRNSIFEEMRMTSLLQKAKTCDAACMNYKDAFKMGTANGGKILGLPVGEIAAGQCADFVGITPDDLSMQPISASFEQLLPNIVYSMQPAAVKKVVVNGEMTVDNGDTEAISQAEIIERVKAVMSEIG